MLLSETKVLVQKKEFLNVHEVPIFVFAWEEKTKQEQLPGSRACCQLSKTAGGPAGDQICPLHAGATAINKNYYLLFLKKKVGRCGTNINCLSVIKRKEIWPSY